jgi:hypothetical protein
MVLLPAPRRPLCSLLADTPRLACARKPRMVRHKQLRQRVRRRLALDARPHRLAAFGPGAGHAAHAACTPLRMEQPQIHRATQASPSPRSPGEVR